MLYFYYQIRATKQIPGESSVVQEKITKNNDEFDPVIQNFLIDLETKLAKRLGDTDVRNNVSIDRTGNGIFYDPQQTFKNNIEGYVVYDKLVSYLYETNGEKKKLSEEEISNIIYYIDNLATICESGTGLLMDKDEEEIHDIFCSKNK